MIDIIREYSTFSLLKWLFCAVNNYHYNTMSVELLPTGDVQIANTAVYPSGQPPPSFGRNLCPIMAHL